MNRIYLDNDLIAFVTNQLESEQHQHWIRQLFLSADGNLQMEIRGKRISSPCAIINHNVPHSFSSEDRIHLSLLIDPASGISRQLDCTLSTQDFLAFDTDEEFIAPLQQLLKRFIREGGTDGFRSLVHHVYQTLGWRNCLPSYDERIGDAIDAIKNNDCAPCSVSALASMMFLSPSRLSHLFKQEIGVPLKSYIQFQQMRRTFLALLGGTSITEAAMGAGFDSPSHFAAVTKRMMGTPASVSLKDSVFLKAF